MNPLEISIYDTIQWGDAARYVHSIRAAGSAPILLRLNSPGGSVFDGYAIFNALAAHKPGVVVEVDGVAASIASYIAMAAGTVRMAENAMMMLHNPTMNISGDEDAARSGMILLEKVRVAMLAAYGRRAGNRLTEEQLIEMMKAETWLSASEAIGFGFADEIIEAKALAACAYFDLTPFLHPPEKLVALAANRKTSYSDFETRLVAAKSPEERAAVMREFYRFMEAGGETRLDPAAKIIAARDAQISGLNAELASVRSDLVRANEALAAERKNLKLLSGLARVRGIDPENAPAVLEDSQRSTPEEYEKRLKAARTTQERGAIVAEFEAEFQAGRIDTSGRPR